MNTNVRHSVGDKVVALTNPATKDSQPRKKGNIYIVKAMQFCTQCGIQVISLGCKANYDVASCTCGNDIEQKGIFWTASKHFAPLSDTTLQYAVEEENYELAAIIRDALKQTEKC
jgi:hypothetical protein